MKYKSTLFFTFILAIILSAFSVVTYAADEVYTNDIFTYTLKNNQATIKSIDNKGLKKIYIPETIDGYEVIAIDQSVSVKDPSTPYELFIPSTVYNLLDTTSPDTALTHLSGVSKFVVDENNEYYSSENGVLYDKAKETLLIFPRSSTIKNLVTPSTCKTIHCRSVSQCNSLETVTLNEGVKVIDNFAFYGSKNLKSINFPEGLEYINQDAFIQCYSLEKVELPSTIKEIENSAFSECNALKEIIIPEGLSVLDIFVFADDISLERIVIPASVKQIKYGALSNCPKLKHIYYAGSEDDWNSIGINDSGTLTDIENAVIHYNYVSSSKFDGLDFTIQNGIMTVTGSDVIPDTLSSDLFFFEENIADVTTIILDGVRYIGEYAFDNYPALSTLIVYNSNISIAENAFKDSNNLINCVFFDSVKIGINSFSDDSDTIQLFISDSSSLTSSEEVSNVNAITYSFTDNVLSFNGSVFFDRYEFFDIISIFCTKYDNIQRLKFTSFSFKDITLKYYSDDGFEEIPIEENTLKNGEITARIYRYGEDVQISFNELISGLGDESIQEFTLIATDENHQDVPETVFTVIRENILRVLKWVVGIMNGLFKIIGKK